MLPTSSVGSWSPFILCNASASEVKSSFGDVFLRLKTVVSYQASVSPAYLQPEISGHSTEYTAKIR
jgi:hypothetical protein